VHLPSALLWDCSKNWYSHMASRVGQNYQTLCDKKSSMARQNVTPCLTFYLFMLDFHLSRAWYLSVRAWYFYLFMLDVYLSRAWYFYLFMLDVYLYMLDVLSVRAWCFICTCLMFYLYVLDVLSVRVWCLSVCAWYLSVRAWYLSVRAWWFYLYVLDGFIRPCLTFLSVRALCFYPSVLDIFVRLCLMFLSNCVWFNPTILDKISLSKISFFVSTGLIFCRSHVFKFSVVLKKFFFFFLLAFFYKQIL
jgi:hypothetical protein